jgi:hypothetical protein
MLRHSYSHKLANDGQDTLAIQGYLGHRSIWAVSPSPFFLPHSVRLSAEAPELLPIIVPRHSSFFGLIIALDGVTRGELQSTTHFGRRGHSRFGECGQRWPVT